MNLREEKEADLAKIVEEIGVPVIWNGHTYQALVTDPTVGEHLELGGFTPNAEFTVKIPFSSLTDGQPKLGDRIEVEEQNCRISKVGRHRQYPMLVLTVGPTE